MAKSTRSSRWAGARVVNLLKQGACLLRNEDCGNQVFQLAMHGFAPHWQSNHSSNRQFSAAGGGRILSAQRRED